MREIKFRAWDKEEKLIVPVCGIVWHMGLIENLNIGGIGHGVSYHDPIDRFELMQFTGLHDKNGKEIYEGDILVDDVGDRLEVCFGKLPLDKSGDCVCTYLAFYAKSYGQLGKPPLYECQQIGDWMKVIGNIHENQELVK